MRKILILMYHMISGSDNALDKKYAVPLRRFKDQMSYLQSKAYTVISLDAVSRYFLDSHYTMPAKPVVLTFDDGYIDHYEKAFPVLRQYNFPATLFIIAGNAGKTSSLWKFKEHPEKRLIGWREINEIKGNGIAIGSHSMTHPFLTRVSQKEAVKEIEGSKKYLEDKTGDAVEDFAYPYGDYNENIVNIVKDSGYKTACVTMPGFNTEKDEIYVLKRLDIYGSDTLWEFAIKLSFGVNDGTLVGPAKDYLKRAVKKILYRNRETAES